ncbi:MAG: hypothetical protein Q9207_008079 [Kuettlingeria erythrocarpa]
MCIIKIRRDQSGEPPVPIRPISRGDQLTATTYPASRISPRVNATAASPQMSRMQQRREQHLRASAGSITHRHSGSQQQIVIAQPSPRTSRPKIPLQHEHGCSYSYGSGPVPTRESLDRLHLSSPQQPQHHQRSYSGQQVAMVGRRSAGSVTFGGANVDPRGSHVSHRSMREKIVIIDEHGRRRESGFH